MRIPDKPAGSEIHPPRCIQGASGVGKKCRLMKSAARLIEYKILHPGENGLLSRPIEQNH